RPAAPRGRRRTSSRPGRGSPGPPRPSRLLLHDALDRLDETRALLVEPVPGRVGPHEALDELDRVLAHDGLYRRAVVPSAAARSHRSTRSVSIATSVSPSLTAPDCRT